MGWDGTTAHDGVGQQHSCMLLTESLAEGISSNNLWLTPGGALETPFSGWLLEKASLPYLHEPFQDRDLCRENISMQ